MAKTVPLGDQVRRAVAASGRSRYRICKDLGIDQATLSRFMSGQRGLTLTVLERLVASLGLQLVGRDKVTPVGAAAFGIPPAG